MQGVGDAPVLKGLRPQAVGQMSGYSTGISSACTPVCADTTGIAKSDGTGVCWRDTGQPEFRESSAQEVALGLNLDKWLPAVVLNEQRCCRMKVLGL